MKLCRGSCAFLLAVLLLCAALFPAGAEGNALCGEWAYRHDPSVTVLTLREDGTAVYGGQALIWQDEGEDLLLADGEGGVFRLAYEAGEEGLTVWLPALYRRISEIGSDGELTGTWTAEGTSQSSFVFTEDGRFLEDGVFTGSYTDEPEHGCITLRYMQGLFADTVLLYGFDGPCLVLCYPWTLVLR